MDYYFDPSGRRVSAELCHFVAEGADVEFRASFKKDSNHLDTDLEGDAIVRLKLDPEIEMPVKHRIVKSWPVR